MAKSGPRPESLLAALPAELSQSLFAKARPLSVKADQTLFVAGDEGDGCYRVEEGLLKGKRRRAGRQRAYPRDTRARLGRRRALHDRRRPALGFGHRLAGFEVGQPDDDQDIEQVEA